MTLPLLLDGKKPDKKLLKDLLEKLGLKERLKHIKGLEGQVNKKYVKQKFKDFWKF